ncbi:unnamed protein product, partial [Urochloa humidicola]
DLVLHLHLHLDQADEKKPMAASPRMDKAPGGKNGRDISEMFWFL